MTELVEKARATFLRRFEQASEVVAIAPGRLELLGNHTDYNEGYVMGLAIDRHIAVAGRRVEGRLASIYTSEFDQEETFNLGSISKNAQASWANYPKGVMDRFQKGGFALLGMKLVIESSVPLGAGVSSSAALLVATALCIQKLFSIALDPMKTVRLVHAAECDFVGANNGMLDHFCSVFGRENHALFLDCRTLANEVIAIPSSDLIVAVCKTNVRHSIVEGEYQARRRECRAAADYFQKKDARVKTLRDVSSIQLEQSAKKLDGLLLKRARHIVGENERVVKGKTLLQKSEMDAFGRLLYESHESSRANFENSCTELDAMVEIAKSCKGVWGSRLTGGGFGGCTLALVERPHADAFQQAIMDQYPKRTGKIPEVLFCKVSEGAKIIV